ncbi:MAG: stage V sporulation protein S [Pleurocapsa minor GSE-CHR-MK-17-07R]|jgi:stage V sporulation protein S|nr:stage V sporulation protein S [Pleurocapsa minor GSE-CHR-MK 17-07R]
MTEHNEPASGFQDFEESDIVSSSPNHADLIRVSAKSRSTSVAGAIAAVMREHRHAEVQAIGAGAVNQAVKALAIARGYLAGDQIDIACVPYFTEVQIDSQERTAVRFIVEPRRQTENEKPQD